MGVLHLLLAQASLVVAGVVDHQIRQADAPDSSSPSGSVSSPTQSSTEPAQSTKSNESRDEGGGGDGGTSPLLFFVALGFGVVFTNLW